MERSPEPSRTDSTPGDPGETQGSLDDVPTFHYATAPNAHAYRAIMQVFYEAKQRYTIELRVGEVVEAIRLSSNDVKVADEQELEPLLAQLVRWGNLARTHDTAAVARIDDFYRKRHVFHLTTLGEAAHRAILEFEANVGKSGSLQTSMLVKIRETLESLTKISSATSSEPGRVVTLLHDLHSAFDTLTREANRFIGDLNRHTDAGRAEKDCFILHKQAILGYISRFVEQLRLLGAEVTASVEAVSSSGIDSIIAVAATSAELPPATDDMDPIAAWVDEQRARWKGVYSWFVRNPADGRPTVERLASITVGAVVGLTRTLGRINDRRSRPVDPAADFRTLARWFAACEDDDDAHSLWQGAFGLYSTRHFHLEEEDAELTRADTSWWDAEPVTVPVRLRVHGNVSKAGRPSQASDHSQEKQRIAELRTRERAQLEFAMERFAGQEDLRLSDVVSLDGAQFDLLLSLLDEALSNSRGPDGTRRAKTADGRLLVVLRQPDEPNSAPVSISTPRGRLTCLDYRITVSEGTSRVSRKSTARAGVAPVPA